MTLFPRFLLSTRHRRWAGGRLFALLLTVLVGCTLPSSGGLQSGRGGSIQDLHLFVMPVPFASTPGGAPDGIAVRVFASSRSSAKAVPIRGGTLELLAFDGTPDTLNSQSFQPAQVWTFPAASLPPLAISTSLGTGYEIALTWRGPRPTNSRLTLVARHTPATGAALLTAPSIMPNALR